MPRRIQRHRTPGYRTPAGVVYVGRPTKWGNPFHLDSYPSSLSETARRTKMVRDYEKALRGGKLRVSIEDVRRELAGKSLSCWCPLDQPCHADVLLRIAGGQRHRPSD
jgi:hypothetical protein